MNGPEHYRRAEAVMAELERQSNGLRARGRMPAAEATHAIAEMAASLQVAQVHATLALAAATAQNIRRNAAIDVDVQPWSEVLDV